MRVCQSFEKARHLVRQLFVLGTIVDGAEKGGVVAAAFVDGIDIDNGASVSGELGAFMIDGGDSGKGRFDVDGEESEDDRLTVMKGDGGAKADSVAAISARETIIIGLSSYLQSNDELGADHAKDSRRNCFHTLQDLCALR
jgi:hypothetical protein